MKSRRHFIQNSSLAALATLASAPIQSIAGSIAPYTSSIAADNTLILLHTSNSADLDRATKLKREHSNVILINPSNHKNQPTFFGNTDTSLIDIEASDYKIIHRGNIKIGFISITAGSQKNIDTVNNLATFLKEEKKCMLVVCLSSLGLKNEKALDDTSLAEQSVDLDIIINEHSTNYTTRPIITKNHKKEEVIIHSAIDNGFALGNIKIEFDAKTNAKKSIAFNNLLTRLPQTA